MTGISLPYYEIEEARLRRNLELIAQIAEAAGVEFILAFKAFALWKTFPVFREYICHTTASSPFEARLAYEEFGSKAHTYSPAYEDGTFGVIRRCSSHITFNSLSQLAHFSRQIEPADGVSIGLRINPEYSEIETLIYNPCAPGSRFGVTADSLPEVLPPGLDGFHVHCHCESPASALVHTLEHVEAKFGAWLPQIKWINLGGGHLVTREGYDVGLLVDTLRRFKARHPHLSVILEPGSAFLWQTGTLRASVVDIVGNSGIKTAILNASFTCHMPDCLEMPYMPTVRGARTLYPEEAGGREREENVYRLGGNSCLSGDFMGYWEFAAPLSVGDEIVFEDMIHYTTVKTNMFNGIAHPAIVMRRTDGRQELLRAFSYQDYRDRMD